MITGNEPISVTHFRDGEINGEGLTIRQHFAAMAEMPWNAVMNTLNARGFKDEQITLEMVAEIRAKYKIIEADALIAELNKTTI